MTPSDSEAAIDAAIDAALPPHDCGTCEWCIACTEALLAMLPTHSDAPF